MKNHAITLCLLAVLLSAPAFAQGNNDAFGDYKALRLNHADEYQGNLQDGRPLFFKGKVDLVLLPATTTTEPMPIKCESMVFLYSEEDPENSAPTAIELTGSVIIDHPDGQVRAEKGVWEFETNKLTFTGNPTMDGAMVKDIRGDTIILDFGTNILTVRGAASFGHVPLQQPVDTALLTADDIKDWTAFLTKLQNQANDEAPSPGKQIAALITDPLEQEFIRRASVDILVQRKKDILKLINKTIENPEFYNAQAFSATRLPPEAKTLLQAGTLPDAKQTQLNRLLFEAAYPEAFK